MTTTLTSPVPTAADTTSGRGLRRVLSAAGAGFALIVIAQNVLRGAGAPRNDASVGDVLAHYRDDTGMAVVLTTMFVIAGLSLAGFVAELVRRLLRRGTDAWTVIGAIGTVGVMIMFAMVVAMEAALVGAAGREAPDLGTIDALWLTHNAVFAVLGLSLGTALLGLGRAASAAGLAPAFFRWLAPAGAAALCVGAAGAPVVADGSVMAAMAPALAGFVVWLVFLLTTSFRMVRSS